MYYICVIIVLIKHKFKTRTTMNTSTLSQEKARKDLFDKIKEILTSDVRFRDNDALLINKIQREEITQHSNINEISINDFFLFRSQGKVSSEDDIVAVRMESQE